MKTRWHRAARIVSALSVVFVVTGGAVMLASASPGPGDTPGDRLACRRAIESVLWSQRIWPADNPEPKPGLEDVLPSDTLAAAVEDESLRVAALEVFWGRRLSSQQLQAELDRMARESKAPAQLRELFEALGNDPGKLVRCLAEPALADQLIRSWYASDPRYHAEVWRTARASLEAARDPVALQLVAPEYEELDIGAGELGPDPFEGVAGDGSPRIVSLPPSEWKTLVDRLVQAFGVTLPSAQELRPRFATGADVLLELPGEAEARHLPIGVVSELVESERHLSAYVVLGRTPRGLQLAVGRWPKRSFDEWWAEARLDARLRDTATRGVLDSTAGAEFKLPTIADTGCARDTWQPLPSMSPAARYSHTAVWTGTELIIWGGRSSGSDALTSGGRYDPATNSWYATAAPPAGFVGRFDHTAVWTGTEMIIWGGLDAQGNPRGDGARYDPAHDSWRLTASAPSVPARYRHTAVWTGAEMIVWGGFGPAELGSGGRYDPASDSWRTIALSGAPGARACHTAVWTGTEMVVWGGRSAGASLATGGRYRPQSDSWQPMSATGAAAARASHTAVWTGSEMIVYGGWGSTVLDDGARYSPGTDTWRTMVSDVARTGHTAVWTGQRMLVWGGVDRASTEVETGALYDPAADSWAKVTTFASAPRRGHSLVWTGTEAIVWGGLVASAASATGGRYSPQGNSWVPTTSVALGQRYYHTAVWTGAEVVVWGGVSDADEYRADGALYRPATDAWLPMQTPTIGARILHTAVWTGSKMIVYGGRNASSALGSGGMYNVASDSWESISGEQRYLHSAVWTGTEMIIWGGRDLSYRYNDGGRFYPSTKTWRAVSEGTNCPDARLLHSAVWTGSEMVVWGGFADKERNNGARYNPTSDSWRTMSASGGVPAARARHTAIWTGSEMIVWGGWYGDSVELGNGGRYDPNSDTWSALSAGAPTARWEHVAVWAGNVMFIWGGGTLTTTVNTGGIYDTGTRTWRATTVDALAPSPRWASASQWMAPVTERVFVWGGAEAPADGALYCLDAHPACPDLDRDGFAACTADCHPSPTSTCGDCNDANAQVSPDGVEAAGNGPTCSDGLDNDCDGSVDQADPGCAVPCLDADGDGYAVCQGGCDPGSKACGDCDDARNTVHPQQAEAWWTVGTCTDSLDNDCDGQWDAFDQGCAPPPAPVGPASGTTGETLTYSASAASCEVGGGVQYQFDWGDGDLSDWMTPAMTPPDATGLAGALAGRRLGELDETTLAEDAPFSYYYQGQLVVLDPSPRTIAIATASASESHGVAADLGWSSSRLDERWALRKHGLRLFALQGPTKTQRRPESSLARVRAALAEAQRAGLVAQPVFEGGTMISIPSNAVIVKFAKETSLAQARQRLLSAMASAEVLDVRMFRPSTFILTIKNEGGGRVFEVSRLLAAEPGIAYAEPNFVLVDAREPDPMPALDPPPRDAVLGPVSDADLRSSTPAQFPAVAPSWVVVLQEGFESGATGWSVGHMNSTTVQADPKIVSARSHTGSKSVYMTGGGAQGVAAPGPYPHGCKAVLTSPTLNLGDFEEAYVELWFWAKMENPGVQDDQVVFYDYGAYYVVVGDESQGWRLVTAYTGDLTADPTTASGWRRVLYRVPPTLRKSGAQLTIAFFSDPESVAFEGMYIDDIRVVGTVDVDTNVISNDPLSARQYELRNSGQIAGLGGDSNDLNVPEAWAVQAVSQDVVVAVIDTGVELTHPDLRLVTGYDGDTGQPGGGPKTDEDNHGQACAGNVGAIKDNGIGVAGTAPGVKIMPIHWGSTNADLVNGIDLAVQHGAKVLSNSWGMQSELQTITDAIDRALAANRIMLFAAGNGPDRPPYDYKVIFPARLTGTKNIIAVGASSPTDEHKNASSSDGLHGWGSSYVGEGPDVVAPGPWSYTTDRTGAAGGNDGDPLWSGIDAAYQHAFGGTSSSTPKVAGIVALMLSRNPDLTPAQVKSILRSTAVDIDAPGIDDRTGAGRVDALAAVLAAGGGGGNPVPEVATIFPSTIVAGSPGFTLTVTGSSFVQGAVVRWNGGDRSTTFVGSTQLTATIAAGDVASAGVVLVTVFNPAPGGGTSGAQSFTITGEASGSARLAHTWRSAGAYAVRVRARCASNTAAVSDWSTATQVTIAPPPESVTAPQVPSGPSAGQVNTFYTYTAGGSTSSLGNALQYLIDWGDGTDSGWLPVGQFNATKSWPNAGNYDVRARARSSVNLTVESSASTARTVMISVAPASGPDLAGSWKYLKQTCKTKKGVERCTVRAQITVRNAGDLVAGPSRIAWLVSADAFRDASDTPLGSASVPSLKPGKTKTITLNYAFPAGTSGRGKYFIAVLDAAGAVTERDESNNELRVQNGP